MRLSIMFLIPLLCLPIAQAQQLSDPEGDAALRTGAGAPPYAAAVDILDAAWEDDTEGLAISVHVTDLSARTAPGQYLYGGLFWTSYQDPSGAAARTGLWETRAHYDSIDDTWMFFVERPCLDGNDDDGCAGEDRDIVDVQGIVDEPGSIVTVLVPWDVMADPASGDGLIGLIAYAQAQVPATFTAVEDWDLDEADQCYRFSFSEQALPLRAEPAMASQSQSGNGRNGLPYVPDVSPCPAPDETATTTQAVASEAAPAETAPLAGAEDPVAETATQPVEDASTHEAPGFGIIGVTAIVAVACLRRR